MGRSYTNSYWGFSTKHDDTASFDHDIIDGAPAARFSQRLKELIESGYGITEQAGDG